MGTRQDSEDVRENNGGGRSVRETCRGNFSPLVSAGLIALGAVLAAGAYGVDAPGGRRNPAVLPNHQSLPVVRSKGFSSDRAWKDLIKQVDFGPRVPMTEGHQKCSDYIVAEMKKTCDDVHLQPLEHTWSSTGNVVKMWNIIGTQNWSKASSHVVLFAHWDTRPTADEDTTPARRAQPIPGANDGASGVAVLLELARVLKITHPNVGVMYVMTDGEDLGPGLDEMFLGARYWAANLPSVKPNYGILLDMIGQKNVRVPMEPNSLKYAGNFLYDLYKHAEKIGLASAFPMVQGPEIEDDHLSINEAGVPTIDLIDFDYMPYWHTLTDTPDKCSAESLGKIGKLLQSWLQSKPTYAIGG